MEGLEAHAIDSRKVGYSGIPQVPIFSKTGNGQVCWCIGCAAQIAPPATDFPIFAKALAYRHAHNEAVVPRGRSNGSPADVGKFAAHQGEGGHTKEVAEKALLCKEL